MCEGYSVRSDDLWQHTRFIGALLYNANAKNPKSPEQLVPLRSDKYRPAPPKIDVNRLKEVMKQHQLKLDQANGK